MRTGLIAMGAAVLLAGCGSSSTKTIHEVKTVSVVAAKASTSASTAGATGATESGATGDAGLTDAQQKVIGKAVGYALIRCGFGSGSAYAAQDSQIASALRAYVAVYKQLGPDVQFHGKIPTTLGQETQDLVSKLTCAPALEAIVQNGTGVSLATTSTGTGTGPGSSTINPKAESACLAIIGQIANLRSPNALTVLGKDILKLLPVVSPGQQPAVIGAVGAISRVLKDLAAGRLTTSDSSGMKAAAGKIAQICATYVPGG